MRNLIKNQNKKHYFDTIQINDNFTLNLKTGNTDDDRLIKRQMFEDVIRGTYYCDFVLDDRDKVVRMWREELGLTCLQVNYGDF